MENMKCNITALNMDIFMPKIFPLLIDVIAFMGYEGLKRKFHNRFEAKMRNQTLIRYY
jgi:hypothetical protein